MTRKDYVKIAKALADVQMEGADMLTLMKVTRNLAHVLQEDNPRFNSNQFIEAAGILPALVEVQS